MNVTDCSINISIRFYFHVLNLWHNTWFWKWNKKKQIFLSFPDGTQSRLPRPWSETALSYKTYENIPIRDLIHFTDGIYWCHPLNVCFNMKLIVDVLFCMFRLRLQNVPATSMGWKCFRINLNGCQENNWNDKKKQEVLTEKQL